MSSSRKRAVVIGASGLIGHHLLREGGARDAAVVGTSFRQQVHGLVPLDITDTFALANFLREQRPEVVFFPAATPNVDLCETDHVNTRRVNVAPIESMTELAGELGARLVYYSTDYLFDGRAGPYTEEDRPNPINEYGRQKLEAERIIRSRLPNDHLILRITVVYGWERQGKNFVTRLVRTLREGQSMRVPDDQIGTPTLVDDLAQASWELVERRTGGTYNVVGPDLVDRYTFACRVAEAFGLDARLLQPVSTLELGQAAPRPLRAGLRADRAEALLRRRMLDVSQGLQVLTSRYTL